MSNSLRDQMLKAGLVSKGKVKLEKQNVRKKKRRAPQQGNTDQAVSAAAQARKKAQQERDRALNLEREQARARKALKVQMRQLLRARRLNDKAAEERYNFSDGDRLKSLYVTREQRRLLVEGKLAIVMFGESQYLVPLEVVEKARALDGKVKVHITDSTNTDPGEDADDPYAAYKVPDDLIW